MYRLRVKYPIQVEENGYVLLPTLKGEGTFLQVEPKELLGDIYSRRDQFLESYSDDVSRVVQVEIDGVDERDVNAFNITLERLTWEDTGEELSSEEGDIVLAEAVYWYPLFVILNAHEWLRWCQSWKHNPTGYPVFEVKSKDMTFAEWALEQCLARGLWEDDSWDDDPLLRDDCGIEYTDYSGKRREG